MNDFLDILRTMPPEEAARGVADAASEVFLLFSDE